jgi:PTS system sucrose-specific IIC component
MLSSGGLNIWMPIATAANVGQGAATLALAVKTKNNKTKSIALPAALSAFLGITEPAIFGVNIRYMKVFIAGCIGGACGGLVAGITGIGATGYGITGIFGFLITTSYALQYALVMGISFVTAFAAAWLMYREKPKVHRVGSVVSGSILPLSEVPDETFSGEVLGKGFAVRPQDNVVVAPADGVISTVAATGHAIGMTTTDGMELLIHIGIDTVRLQGEHFTVSVEEGQKVAQGQTLATFDRAAVEDAGYSALTMVIVTNSEEYKDFELKKSSYAKAGEEALRCS